LDILLDPHRPEIVEQARQQNIPETFITAAQHSPVYALIKKFGLALPLHPEFRTMPMVWYIPPLSPIAEHSDVLDSPASVDRLRIPIRYLSNLLTAGDEAPVRLALKRLVAVREYMRSTRVEQSPRTLDLEDVGLSSETADEIYRLIALANLGDRFVIPTVQKPDESCLYIEQGGCGFK
jgi:nitrate reductase beta subunit